MKKILRLSLVFIFILLVAFGIKLYAQYQSEDLIKKNEDDIKMLVMLSTQWKEKKRFLKYGKITIEKNSIATHTFFEDNMGITYVLEKDEKGKKTLFYGDVKTKKYIRYEVFMDKNGDEFFIIPAKKFDDETLKWITRIKNDKTIVLKAVDRNEKVFEILPEEMKNDMDVIKTIVSKNKNGSFKYFPHLKSNKDLIEIAISSGTQGAKNLEGAPESIIDDFDIAKIAVKNNGQVLKFLSNRLRNNIEIANLSFEQDPENLQFAGEQIKDNEEIVKKLVEKKGEYKIYLKNYMSPRLQSKFF